MNLEFRSWNLKKLDFELELNFELELVFELELDLVFDLELDFFKKVKHIKTQNPENQYLTN